MLCTSLKVIFFIIFYSYSSTLYPCKQESIYLTAMQHQPSPVSPFLVTRQTTTICDCSRWEEKCANHKFAFFKAVEEDECRLSEKLKQRALKIMHQSKLVLCSLLFRFSVLFFLSSFVSAEQNVMFPSGYFDYRRNQA